MFNFEGLKIFFYTVPIDMRNAIDGLSVKVAQEMSCDVQTGVFVFYNKGRNKIKILYWERNGFWMIYKRLEKEKFKIPELNGKEVALTTQQLRWILDGLDYTKLEGHKDLKYSLYS